MIGPIMSILVAFINLLHKLLQCNIFKAQVLQQVVKFCLCFAFIFYFCLYCGEKKKYISISVCGISLIKF